jgi:hypothetical protein
MTKCAALGKFFIKPSRVLRPEGDFQNACLRYVDKWLATRSFLRLFFRVTPEMQANRKFQLGPAAHGFLALAQKRTAAQREPLARKNTGVTSCRGGDYDTLRRNASAKSDRGQKRKSPA